MKKILLRNATIELMFLVLISKIVGFAREIVISYMYGTSSMSDAYSMANSIAVLIITGLATGIMTVFIPECMSFTEDEVKNKFTSNVLNSILIVSAVVAGICLLFTKQIISLIGIGFSEQTKEYTEILFRFVVLSSICIFTIYVINGYLNTKKNFYYNGFQLIITNLIITLAVLLSQNSPIRLGVGYLIAYIIPLLIGIYFMKKHQFYYQKYVAFYDVRLKKLFIASVIAFLGTNVVKINVMLDRIFASSLQEGAVAAINYAFTLTAIVPEVFAMSLATVLYPHLSDLYIKGEDRQFAQSVSRLMIQTTILLIPITIIFFSEGDWIVQVLFERGAFDENATMLTLKVLQGYALGMLPMGFSFVLSKVFFARKEEIIPMISLGACIIVKLLFNILLPDMGIFELAVTTSLAVAIASFAMFLLFIKRNKNFNGSLLFKATIKSCLAGIIMIAVIAVCKKLLLPISTMGILYKFLLLGIVSAISLFIYLVMMYLMRVEEVQEGLELIRRKIKIRG